MKVLFISPNFNIVCGRSRIVFNLMKGLLKNNIGCEIMTNGGDALGKLEELNIKVHIEDINPDKKSISGFLNARRKLSQLTARNEFKIVHVHHRYYDILLSSLTNKNFKSVHTVHSYLSGRRSFGFNADLIIPVSNFIREHLKNDHKVGEDKISMIYNFINPDDYNLNLSSKKSDGVFELLTVGRFHPEKDIMTQLQAMTLLKDTSIRLTVCGDGGERDTYQKFIKENNINVVISDKANDVSEKIINSDVCLMSSINEPFGLFVLESGLFRKPFIGADSGGIKELIENNKTGYFFTAGDYENLAKIIKEVMNDFSKATECGENLFEHVKNNFTIERGITDYINSYHKILDE